MVEYVRAARLLRSVLSRRYPSAPGWVAAVCVLALVVGVVVAVTSRPSNPSAQHAVRAPTADQASPRLPKVTPNTGNQPVVPGFGMKADFAVPAVQLSTSSRASVAPLRTLRQADLLVVSSASLPATTLKAVRSQRGVTSAEQIEAVRMRINGLYTAVLGVNPSVFRSYAERPTARSNTLWDGVADGGIAVSYTMGRLDHLSLGGSVKASGTTAKSLRVVAFGTMGIGGIDAVVSDAVARDLGMPAGNAIVISASSPSNLISLESKVHSLLPTSTVVEPLVRVVHSGAPAGSPATSTQVMTMLRAAYSRLGMPYVWGAAGPKSFDCSGLVQWSFAQAGVAMPRVAADQALTGSSVPISKLEAGDLLFYHTDPTAPNYISHVAIYLGNGWMIQAPRPGLDVEVVPASFGSEFAGAVRVDPALAAQVAASAG